jgi:hypothetical protein
MIRPLSRRTLLRGALGGAGVAVGLPWLEAMAPRRASAGEGDFPDRFGVWFYGNGVKPDQWVPPTVGAGWTPSEELAPLADLVDHVSPISGFEMKTGTHAHHSGMAGVLTGQLYHQLGTTRDTIVSTFARRSVDQDAAEWFLGRTVFRSLEVGITQFWGTDEGSTFEHVSHNGPNSPNPAEVDPARLYARLFTDVSNPKWNLARSSVLDAVREQTATLTRRLGAADRARMEQHTESIRGLERRIAMAAQGVCDAPTPPTAILDSLAHEEIAERNRVQSQLLAFALACDLTRSFSVQFSSAGAATLFWQVGAVEGMHGLCHNESGEQPQVHANVVFTMEMFADFLRILRDTPEGDGDLLAHSSIIALTELSEGSTHSNREFPILLAGGGNGRLRPGIHHREINRNTSDAVLTALHGAGVALPSWGVAEGYTESPVSELLVG